MNVKERDNGRNVNYRTLPEVHGRERGKFTKPNEDYRMLTVGNEVHS